MTATRTTRYAVEYTTASGYTDCHGCYGRKVEALKAAKALAAAGTVAGVTVTDQLTWAESGRVLFSWAA